MNDDLHYPRDYYPRRIAMRRRPWFKVRPLFAWYDMWIGAFWDRKSRKLYILPLPCLGVVIGFD